MGCDIHLFVEVKTGGKWESADKWTHGEYDKDGEVSIDYNDRLYTGRNYDLFAILADVRNGRGFAGVDTGDGFVPIDEPRGLPDDVCTEIKKESDSWNGDGHSHSWFTLADLLAYDWTQKAIKRGWVNAVEYFEWGKGSKSEPGPKSYSGGVSGGSIQHISEQEMIRRIEEVKKPFIESNKGSWYFDARKQIAEQLRDFYCLVQWEEKYYQATSYFWSDCIPQLHHLGKPDDVRIVFWFDN